MLMYSGGRSAMPGMMGMSGGYLGILIETDFLKIYALIL